MKKILLTIFVLLISASVQAVEMSFVFARLKYDNQLGNPRPNALGPLREFIVGRTSLEIEPNVVDVAADSNAIFEYPFLIWTGDRAFSPLSDRAIENLQAYLRFGGFIFAEDVQGTKNLGFDQSFRRELTRLFPKDQLQTLEDDHTVFRSFFLVKSVAGRHAQSPTLQGMRIHGRTVLIYSMNDLQGAWSKDVYGNPEYEVKPSGEAQRQMAYRLGVNLVLYALCDDYKKDSLHMNYILNRRRSF